MTDFVHGPTFTGLVKALPAGYPAMPAAYFGISPSIEMSGSSTEIPCGLCAGLMVFASPPMEELEASLGVVDFGYFPTNGDPRVTFGDLTPAPDFVAIHYDFRISAGAPFGPEAASNCPINPCDGPDELPLEYHHEVALAGIPSPGGGVTDDVPGASPHLQLGWIRRTVGDPPAYDGDPTNEDLDTLFTPAEANEIAWKIAGSYSRMNGDSNDIRLFCYWIRPPEDPETTRRRAMVV